MEESAEDDVIVGTESSRDTTESFKITLRSNNVNLNSIKDKEERKYWRKLKKENKKNFKIKRLHSNKEYI